MRKLLLFWSLLAVAVSLGLGAASTADAIPYFARKFDTGCGTCHTVVPKLNQTGLDFRTRGYRLPGSESQRTPPIAAWVSGRYENRPDANTDRSFFDKVELITGGPLSSRLSVFAEWRVLSLALSNDGSLSDRSGRFEDLFLTYDLAPHLQVTAGQFRLFDQFDSSLRLSNSTPVALNAGVRGTPEPGDSAREASLRGFSPAGRSPAVRLTYRVPTRGPAPRPANGWTFHVSLPFAGELSVPLTDEASDRASFEFDGNPKGVYLEAYHRHGLSSFGGAAFLDGGRQLYTVLGSLDPGWWNTTLALSSARIEGDSDLRVSWWNEIQPWRGVNFGFRLDDTDFGPAAYHLYTDLQWASPRGVLWLLLEQRFRDGDDRSIVQLNAVF